MNALEPAFASKNAICFASDDNYLKYLYVALMSLIDNTSKDNEYDIVILHHKLSRGGVELLQGLQQDNISIRFVEMEPFVSEYDSDVFFTSMHISIATYYRLFVPEIFTNYDKVLYCDCDIVINDNIYSIFNINMTDSILGVIKDVGIARFKRDNKIHSYFNKILKIDVSNYFNAGVILFNIKNALMFNLRRKAFDILKKIKNPQYMDQDILNATTHGHNVFLPVEWNFQWGFEDADERKKAELLAVDPYYRAYFEASKAPKIVHYICGSKAWHTPFKRLSKLWWKYAESSPFYHEFIKNLLPLFEEKDMREIIAPAKRSLYAKYKIYMLLAMFSFGEQRKKWKVLSEKYHAKYRNIRSYLSR